MNELRVRLMTNRYRLAFPHALAILHDLVPHLQPSEPEWLAIARALETVEPAGTRPPGFTWIPEATLRPDDGPPPEHLAAALTFAHGFPAWLLEIPLPGNPDGLGRFQRGLVLLQTPELLQLLPHLFTDAAPAVWARPWPSLQEAAMDFDHLDPCCDGVSGYFVELFRGRHEDTRPRLRNTQPT